MKRKKILRMERSYREGMHCFTSNPGMVVSPTMHGTHNYTG